MRDAALPDVLDDRLADLEPAAYVTSDQTVYDELRVGDIVFMDEVPYAFLFKQDKPLSSVFRQ